MVNVSVLMGVYNEKNRKNVKKAINSILNQTYTNFEFIICDDGSDFKFYEWLQEYCSQDERIHLLRNEKNKGLAATLNKCLKYAKGMYIARMDADDVAMPERFEKQISFLEENNKYAMVGCNVKMIDEKGIWGERKLPEIPSESDFLYTSPYVHPSIMMRRVILEELNGYEESSWAERAEDYELFMRLHAVGYKGYNMQDALFYYREDKSAYNKRKYRYRINESYIRYKGFKKLGILSGHFLYVIKPLIVGLVPRKIMIYIKENNLENK